MIENDNLREDLDWPRQPPVFTRSQIILWRNSLKKALCDSNSTENERKLLYRYQVGKWLDETIINKWILFYSDVDSQLYMKEGSRWKSFCKVGRSRRQMYAENPGLVNNKPASACMLASAHQEGALNRLHIESISNF